MALADHPDLAGAGDGVTGEGCMHDDADDFVMAKGWTLETLFYHFATLIKEHDKRYAQLNTANEKAILTANSSVEKSSEKAEEGLKEYKTASNEWRDTVKDLVSRMPTRVELEAAMRVFDQKIDRLETENRRLSDAITTSAGKSVGMDKMWQYIVAAAGSGGVAAFFLEKFVK